MVRNKINCIIIFILGTFVSFGQIGINTESPKSSFDIEYSGETRVKDGLLVPRLTLKQLTDKGDSVYNTNQLGALIYITDVADGNQGGPRVNIARTGFYYFNGSKWLLLDGSSIDTNIYNTNGSLDSDRTVDLNGKTLNFNATSTGVNVLNMDSTSGNVGIGTEASMSNRLSVSATEDPINLLGVKQGGVDDKLLALTSDGNVREVGTGSELLSTMSIPTPAVFSLTQNVTNFLKNANAGIAQKIPKMAMIKNMIKGLSYDEAQSAVTLPPGTYQMTLTYEATHSIACTVSSYFFDFPADEGRARIHTTATHMGNHLSNHGGTISYIGTLTREKKFSLDLGRGQSGNCTGSNLELMSKATQFLIYRIGD